MNATTKTPQQRGRELAKLVRSASSQPERIRERVQNAATLAKRGLISYSQAIGDITYILAAK